MNPRRLHPSVREIVTESAEQDPAFIAALDAVNGSFQTVRAALPAELLPALLDLDAAIGLAVSEAIESGFELGVSLTQDPARLFYAVES